MRTRESSVAQLRQRSMPLIIVTHDQAEADDARRRIVVDQRPQIQQVGPRWKITAAPPTASSRVSWGRRR
jgi:ABC-type Fe3+/spermidine/putrescine transport system ATPase subunit